MFPRRGRSPSFSGTGHDKAVENDFSPGDSFSILTDPDVLRTEPQAMFFVRRAGRKCPRDFGHEQEPKMVTQQVLTIMRGRGRELETRTGLLPGAFRARAREEATTPNRGPVFRNGALRQRRIYGREEC